MIEKSDMELNAQNYYDDREVSPQYNETNDSDTEFSLRPKTLNEYIGQDKANT